MPRQVRLLVNDAEQVVTAGDAELLCDTLRNGLQLTGTKVGCREGVCGSCDVLLDGVVVRSCLVLTAQAEDATITTVEGLAGADGLSVLQEEFAAAGAVQCGFCTAGMLVAATAALSEQPRAGEEDVAAALAGNLCRCTGYGKIVDAVLAAAGRADG